VDKFSEKLVPIYSKTINLDRKQIHCIACADKLNGKIMENGFMTKKKQFK
jgi:hypothetical protein